MSIKQVEDRIRNAVNAKKVRCTEYFKDYDRLRTGYITSKINNFFDINIVILKLIMMCMSTREQSHSKDWLL